MNTKQAATAAIRRVEMELRIIRAQASYEGWAAGLARTEYAEAERQAQVLKAMNPLRHEGEEYR